MLCKYEDIHAIVFVVIESESQDWEDLGIFILKELLRSC